LLGISGARPLDSVTIISCRERSPPVGVIQFSRIRLSHTHPHPAATRPSPPQEVICVLPGDITISNAPSSANIFHSTPIQDHEHGCCPFGPHGRSPLCPHGGPCHFPEANQSTVSVRKRARWPTPSPCPTSLRTYFPPSSTLELHLILNRLCGQRCPQQKGFTNLLGEERNSLH
jgi:hypothetical protein